MSFHQNTALLSTTFPNFKANNKCVLKSFFGYILVFFRLNIVNLLISGIYNADFRWRIVWGIFQAGFWLTNFLYRIFYCFAYYIFIRIILYYKYAYYIISMHSIQYQACQLTPHNVFFKSVLAILLILLPRQEKESSFVKVIKTFQKNPFNLDRDITYSLILHILRCKRLCNLCLTIV